MELTQEIKAKFEAILYSKVKYKESSSYDRFFRDDVINAMFEAYLLDREEWISAKDEL